MYQAAAEALLPAACKCVGGGGGGGRGGGGGGGGGWEGGERRVARVDGEAGGPGLLQPAPVSGWGKREGKGVEGGEDTNGDQWSVDGILKLYQKFAACRRQPSELCNSMAADPLQLQ